MLTTTTFGVLALLPGLSDKCSEEFLHIQKLQPERRVSHGVGVLIAYWFMQHLLELERQ
jgi:hypothetical protein